MSVVVSFVKPTSRGSAASGIGSVRASETLAVGGTTTSKVDDGEMVIVGNAESSMVVVAFGTAPDAAVNGVPVPSGGLSYPMFPNTGDRINVKAVT